MSEGTHYKKRMSFHYASHVPNKLSRAEKYLYVHGKDKTIDIFDADTMEIVHSSLNTDNEKFVIALEMDDNTMVAACSNGHTFKFDLDTFERKGSLKIMQTPMSAFKIDYNTVLVGQESGYI